MILEHVRQWHERARPAVDDKAFNVQLGCHFEEIAEMMKTMVAVSLADESRTMRMDDTDLYEDIVGFANALKNGKGRVFIEDKEEFLDSLGDQIVTAVGVGHCSSVNVPRAVEAINTSNWSKFVDGQPVLTEQGKIAKGPDYAKPDLTGLW